MSAIALLQSVAFAQTQVPDSVSSGGMELLKQGGFATGMVIGIAVAVVFYRLYKAERQNNVELMKSMVAQAATVTTNEAKFEETARRIAEAITKGAEETVRLRDELRETRMRLDYLSGRAPTPPRTG